MKELKESLDFLNAIRNWQPEVGIILGTGLGGLANEVDVVESIPYGDIPHFPVSTVESHKGRMLFGSLQGKRVVVMQGRFHFYEGYSMEQLVFPVRIMLLMGIKSLFISNAAGGLNPEQKVSDLMIIEDHINLLPDTPLRGPNHNDLGPRFPDMSEAYSRQMVDRALALREKIDVGLHKGVYAAVQGPILETPAEYRYIRTIGADAVGMSTVPEVISAVHMGMKNIFAVSVITDLGVPGKIKKVTVEEVLEAASIAEPHLTTLMKEMISSSFTN